MNINVQFSNSKSTEIVSVFCCEQDAKNYKFLGVVSSDDDRYVTFKEKLNEVAKRSMPDYQEAAQ